MPRIAGCFFVLTSCLLVTVTLGNDNAETQKNSKTASSSDSPVIIPAENPEISLNALTEEEEAAAAEGKDMQVDPVSGRRMYEGYRLVRASPYTKEHLDILRFISNGIEDYWTPIPADTTALGHVDMLVSPKNFDHVTGYLNCSGLPYNVTIENLQKSIDLENVPTKEAGAELVGRPEPQIPNPFSSSSSSFPFAHYLTKRQINLGSILRSVFRLDSDQGDEPARVRTTRHFNAPPPPPQQQQQQGVFHPNNIPLPVYPGFCTTRSNFHWQSYHRVSTIHTYIDCLAEEHKDKVELFEIGSSYNNQRLPVLKIGRGGGNPDRRAIWIDGGIHAREWISPASVLYVLHQLVENYDANRDIVDNFDVYIMPVMNPDGYEYTHTHDRMWRKTRSNPSNHHSNSVCVGTDPNRNFGYKWGGEGASDNPCTETYRGSAPFSEKETNAVQQFISQRAKEFKLYLTFHSYGQYILYPWGYTNKGVPPNWRDLNSLGQVAASAMKTVSGHEYTIGSAAQVLYPAAGGSDDWAKGAAGIEYSYTIELPDTGRYGFILPAHEIDATVKEAFAGVSAMIRELRNR